MACEHPASEVRSLRPESDASDGGFDGATPLGETTVTPAASTEPRTGLDTSLGMTPTTVREAGVVDAGVRRAVSWGLQPGSPGADAGLAEDTLARLEVLALGSRIMTHLSAGEQDDFAEISRAPGVHWIVTLSSEAFVAMSDEAVAGWLERVWALGDSVRFLIFGQHLEADFAALPSAERQLLATRLENALLRARNHPGKPTSASVGVGVTTMAAVPSALVVASEVLALSYSAVEASGEVTLPDLASDTLVERAAHLSDYGLPLIFQDLAYPSVDEPDHQKAFFSRIRAWFSSPNAADVRAVVVSSLNSPATSDCENWARDWQIEGGAEARCSVGLRDAAGNAKPALSEVVEILAEFAQL